MKITTKKIIYGIILITIIVGILLIPIPEDNKITNSNFKKFDSDIELLNFLKDSQENNNNYTGGILDKGVVLRNDAMVKTATQVSDASESSENSYSETNIQVEGVDEADIIKTDGEYIYTVSSQRESYYPEYSISNSSLIITKAYPKEDAKIISKIDYNYFSPYELFISEDRLLVFGRTNNIKTPNYEIMSDQVNTNIMPKNYYPSNTLTIKLYDISNKEDLKLVKSIDYQGNYITARMIDNYAYFVFNNRPNYSVIKETNNCKEIIPLYRETTDNNSEFMPITKCTDIGYVESINADNFITVASIKLENGNTQSETILGRGQNIYSSLKNLYVVQTVSSNNRSIGLPVQKYIPETIITKFNLNQGNINFSAIGNVKGIILNQFSMDEYNDNFRIATTISGYDNENNIDISTNNMYILDKDLKLTGKIEDIAKGESIYSVRFMGKKAYMVTFKHIDPLFVIDLEDPTNPKILGKLKIPGYSDYLHPYDENYLIGIGKEVDASIDADKIHTEGAVYYTAIQGVKLAIFDVSNVSNPIEIHKEVIGDRGTESIATKDHKSFLFDKQKNLLIIPMIVAELNNGQNKSQQGNYTFSGAYVYNLDLENGFNLRGRVTHYDSNEPFEKAGYYFRGNNDIKRSLYIKDVLYTFSNNRLQLNNLNTLELLKKIELN